VVRLDERNRCVRHIVEVGQFERPWVEQLFTRSDAMRSVRASDGLLSNRLLATLFYEPSTRTRLSFESAMLRLGGQVISTENAREFSSAIKGESVEDTVRIIAAYADGVVIRHFEQGAAARAASVSPVPVINGGDGPGEHPTQALLDLYTIRHELGTIDDLTIALVGDLRYGRAARSLALLLGMARGTRLLFVAPPAVPMGTDVKSALDQQGVEWHDTQYLDQALTEADVVYQTRIQRERFVTPSEARAAEGHYVIDAKSMQRMQPGAILLHPLPRVDEIDPEVDTDPRAAYFRQAENGVYVRMALLHQLLASQEPER
jgi:aspartate carbamoyltransferase catalytic subunit